MKTKHYLTCFSMTVLLAITGCGQKATSETTTNTTSEATTDTPPPMMPEKIIDPSGYTTGIITRTKQEGNCQWVITLKDGRIFETTDMGKEFMRDGAEVFFKFRGLRRMSTCPGANPVEITEMITKG